jgi:hypothetical protein
MSDSETSNDQNARRVLRQVKRTAKEWVFGVLNTVPALRGDFSMTSSLQPSLSESEPRLVTYSDNGPHLVILLC